MIISQMQFAGAFMFLAVLLLFSMIYSKIHWGLKSVLIVSSILFCLFSYRAFEGTAGYPVNTTPPKTFEYLDSYVNPPNPVTGDQGAIYVWIVDHAVSDMPRVIVLPYTDQTHKKVTEAKEKKTSNPNEPLAMGMLKNNILDFKKPKDTLPNKAVEAAPH